MDILKNMTFITFNMTLRWMCGEDVVRVLIERLLVQPR